MAKSIRKPGQISIPTPVAPGAPSAIDMPNYNIFTDPDLASRSSEFLAGYIANLEEEDYSSILQLDYGKHGDVLRGDDYRRALLADEALYGEADMDLFTLSIDGQTLKYNGNKIDIDMFLDSLDDAGLKKYTELKDVNNGN